MSRSNSRYIAYLIFFAFFSVFAYMLFEIVAQYAFPATYRAQFSDLQPDEAAEIEAKVREWNSRARLVKVRSLRENVADPAAYVDLHVSMDLVERDFSTLASFLSNGELSRYGGSLTLSREPNPLGQKLALLVSILLFLVLLKGLIVPNAERESP